MPNKNNPGKRGPGSRAKEKRIRKENKEETFAKKVIKKDVEEKKSKEIIATLLSHQKHPLAQSWTFWHLNPDTRLSWTEKQKEILSVSTVEDFWAVYNWILQPSKLKSSSDYSLFRTGVRPDWEDAGNVRGGRWVVARTRESLDSSWREVIMALIGNHWSAVIWVHLFVHY